LSFVGGFFIAQKKFEENEKIFFKVAKNLQLWLLE